jgi:hypothetical protein
VFQRLLAALAEQSPIDEIGYLDSTYLKAHRSAHWERADEGPGDRRLARRPDDQDPRDPRHPRAARRTPADTRQHLRHQGWLAN